MKQIILDTCSDLYKEITVSFTNLKQCARHKYFEYFFYLRFFNVLIAETSFFDLI